MPVWWKTNKGEWRIRTSVVKIVKDGWRRVVVSVELVEYEQ